MPHTLLIGGPDHTWRDLRKAHPDRPWLCLDPGDPDTGLLARVALRTDRGWLWRFYGALDPLRAPHSLLAAAAELLREMGEDGFVRLFPWRRSPLARETALLVDRLVRPARILCADPDALSESGWTVGPEATEPNRGFPPVVVQAQRRAHWYALLDQSELREIPLADTVLLGARIGSGIRLPLSEVEGCGVRALWAERCGPTLYLVCKEGPDQDAILRATSVFECSRAQVVSPDQFEGLVCGLSRLNGDDFALGVLQSIDFASGVLRLWTDAVPPLSAPVVKLGGLRLGAKGVELGELKPWQV